MSNTETTATAETTTTEDAEAPARPVGRPVSEATLALRERVADRLADASEPVTARQLADEFGEEKAVRVTNALMHFESEGAAHRVGTWRMEKRRGRPSHLWSASPLAEGQEPFEVVAPNPDLPAETEEAPEAPAEESAE
jgi:hypothetical protein